MSMPGDALLFLIIIFGLARAKKISHKLANLLPVHFGGNCYTDKSSQNDLEYH